MGYPPATHTLPTTATAASKASSKMQINDPHIRQDKRQNVSTHTTPVFSDHSSSPYPAYGAQWRVESFQAVEGEYLSSPGTQKNKGTNHRNDIIQQVQKTPKREQSSKTSRQKSTHPDRQG